MTRLPRALPAAPLVARPRGGPDDVSCDVASASDGGPLKVGVDRGVGSTMARRRGALSMARDVLQAGGQSATRALVALAVHAPPLLAASLVLGALAPEAAALSEAVLPVAALLMTFGSLTTAGLAPRERAASPALLALLLATVAVGPCLLAALAVAALDVSDDHALGVFAAMAGPPVASAAALAAILGLPARFALALSIPPTLLCPLIAPLLLGVFAGAAVDAVALGWRLVVVVGGAGLAAALVLSMRRRSTAGPSPLAAAGVSVIGLVMVGVAAASRARVEAQADPEAFAALLLAAIGLTAGLTLAGALVGAPLGGRRAATLGLVWGFRNQTLVWAALGAALPPVSERLLVAMVLPILIAPLLVRAGRAVWRLRMRA